jgi:5-methylcytosine-specific restriction endonuclease McrA
VRCAGPSRSLTATANTPGCDEPADNCDVDHKQPYADGGETSQENAEIECRPHNRDKTKHTKKPRRDPPEPRPPPTD